MPALSPRDKSYQDGYHWGIKHKEITHRQQDLDTDGWDGGEDGNADHERIVREGTLEEQLRESLRGLVE